MPRGLSTAAKAYTGPFVWAVKITLLDSTIHRFSTDAVTFLGDTYLPYLGQVGDIRLNRSLDADGGEISLLNADLFIGALLESNAFEGALCELYQLLLGIDEAILIFRGRLVEQQEREAEVGFQLIAELDPAAIKVPAREYSHLCTWRYNGGSGPLAGKSPQCGSTSALATCPKDFQACVARAATHRFNGFPTLTPELARLAGATPGAPPLGGGSGAAPTGGDRTGGGPTPKVPL